MPRSVPRNNGRLSYLNYIRISAILLVILRHCLIPFLNISFLGSSSPAERGLFLFLNELDGTGVPLFFMLSGFLMLRDGRTINILPFYQRRLQRILLPLILWNGIYALWYRMTFREFVAESINQGCAYHLWFMYQLLGLYLLAPFLKRLVDTCSRPQLWWLFIFIIFPGTLRPLWNIATPFYLFLFNPLIEVYAGYFLLGYLLGSTPLKPWHLPMALMAILAGLGLGICGNYLCVVLGKESLFFSMGYTLNHFLLGAGFYLLARQLPFLNRLSWVKAGMNLASLTFQVYFVHVLVIDLYQKWAPELPPLATVGLEWLLTVAVSFTFAFLWRTLLKGALRIWKQIEARV